MNETMQQIVNACVPVLCLLITAGGAYAVALLRRETARLQKEIDNETANKYMDMAVDAVEQAVASTAQTFVDALKSSGGFTKEKQLEAFQKSRDKALEILGDTAVAALNEIYGDFDAWIDTKIEQVCRDLKRPDNGGGSDNSSHHGSGYRGQRSDHDRSHYGAAARWRSSGHRKHGGGGDRGRHRQGIANKCP